MANCTFSWISWSRAESSAPAAIALKCRGVPFCFVQFVMHNLICVHGKLHFLISLAAFAVSLFLVYRPKRLQDKIFKRLFEAAEIAKFTPEERDAYEESLKHYRDLKNVVNTSREEGIEQGIRETAKRMKAKGVPNSEISEWTGLSDEDIDEL
ncbi:MAG: Rpn family recombination-promoting nuclease/putative transposase [bacterium]|nr:Rpn family recombination-promoting nuclease/putative transposase [bacterium]